MKQHLSKIQRFYEQKKRMPSFAEIAEMLGFKSKNAVARVVDKLYEAGLVGKDERGRLLPGRTFGEVPMLGVVEAGFPTHAEEDLSETMNIDEYLIKNREATFLLKVKGESMIDAGILPGDLVLVERGKEPRLGDIVIANVDNEWTMKYFQKQNGRVILIPANSKFPAIVPRAELKVAAIVRGVVRKYI